MGIARVSKLREVVNLVETGRRIPLRLSEKLGELNTNIKDQYFLDLLSWYSRMLSRSLWHLIDDLAVERKMFESGLTRLPYERQMWDISVRYAYVGEQCTRQDLADHDPDRVSTSSLRLPYFTRILTSLSGNINTSITINHILLIEMTRNVDE